MKKLIEMKDITKRFPGVIALDNVSLDLYPGELHALCGENGAGKSTLMKVLSGVYHADEGEVFVGGEIVNIDNPRAAQDLGISIIYQEFNLYPHLSVADNIWLDRQPKNGPFIKNKTMVEKTQEILDELGISLSPNSVVRNLSVAEQQMVEIAKALSFNSKILVLDEPTAALTDSEIDTLFGIIAGLKKKNVGMFYISHRLEELSRIADRVSVIRDGAYIGTHNYKDTSTEEIVEMMVGRELDDKFPAHNRQIGDVIFEARNVKNSHVDVENVKLRAGEIVGLAGLMGAGRTEFARTLFGADKVDSKELFLDGKPVNIKNVRNAIDAGIFYVTEDRKHEGLALTMDVSDNINMAYIPQLEKFGFIDEEKERTNAETYATRLGVKTPSLQQKVGKLSGGNQQKVVLAKWLCNDIKVIIFDEPTRGIDVGAKYEIYKLMNELSDEGVAILMISSELPEILGMSDRVLVMHDGKIAGELDGKTATQEKILTYAAGLKGTAERGA